MRVASYNIRKAVGLDWQRDPHRIEAVIGELDADVIALQEADRRFGARSSPLCRQRLQVAGYHAVGPAQHSDGIGFRGNALLVRDGLQVHNARAIALPGLEPRGAVFARVEGITIVGAHLGLTAAWRRRQVSEIVREIGKSARAIVLADFNEWRNCNRNLSGFPDGFTIHVPGRSFHAALPRVALDMVITGPGLTASEMGVHTSALSRRASDHLPVWAEIEDKEAALAAV